MAAGDDESHSPLADIEFWGSERRQLRSTVSLSEAELKIPFMNSPLERETSNGRRQ